MQKEGLIDKTSESGSSAQGSSMADWSYSYDRNQDHLGQIPYEGFVQDSLTSPRQIARPRDTRKRRTKQEEMSKLKKGRTYTAIRRLVCGWSHLPRLPITIASSGWPDGPQHRR